MSTHRITTTTQALYYLGIGETVKIFYNHYLYFFSKEKDDNFQILRYAKYGKCLLFKAGITQTLMLLNELLDTCEGTVDEGTVLVTRKYAPLDYFVDFLRRVKTKVNNLFFRK